MLKIKYFLRKSLLYVNSIQLNHQKQKGHGLVVLLPAMRSSKRTIRRCRRVNRFYNLPIFLFNHFNRWISSCDCFHYTCMSWFLTLQLQGRRKSAQILELGQRENFPICYWSCRISHSPRKSKIFLRLRNWRDGGKIVYVLHCSTRFERFSQIGFWSIANKRGCESCN